MKKIIGAVFCVMSAVAVWAGNNTVTMVTYFPTPYMTYQNLYIKDTTTVGLKGNALLQAQDFASENMVVVGNKTLSLYGTYFNTNDPDEEFTLISGPNEGAKRGTLQFDQSLTISSGLPNAGIMSVETGAGTGRATLGSLKLGNKVFPTCDDGEGGHVISWKNLTINGTSGTFLVCGNAAAPQCADGYIPNGSKCYKIEYSNYYRTHKPTQCSAKVVNGGPVYNDWTLNDDRVSVCPSEDDFISQCLAEGSAVCVESTVSSNDDKVYECSGHYIPVTYGSSFGIVPYYRNWRCYNGNYQNCTDYFTYCEDASGNSTHCDFNNTAHYYKCSLCRGTYRKHTCDSYELE